jgi:hypothetical protein
MRLPFEEEDGGEEASDRPAGEHDHVPSRKKGSTWGVTDSLGHRVDEGLGGR